MDRSSEIGAVFDEMSSEYTGIMDDMVPHYRVSLAAMLEYVPEGVSVNHILDLGCGNGNVTALCRAVYPDAHIHLLDASADMLALCRERFGTANMTFEQHTFQKFQPGDQSFDLITAGMSVHHLNGAEKSALFAKLYGALKPGGVFACADLMIDKRDQRHPEFMESWQRFIYANGRTEEDWIWLTDHYEKYDRPSSFDDMRGWLSDAGFQEVELSWNDGFWGCFHATKPV